MVIACEVIRRLRAACCLHWRAVVQFVAITTAVVSSSCSPVAVEETKNAAPAESAKSAPTSLAEPLSTSASSAKPESILGGIAWIEDEQDRWLFVRAIRGEAEGAWATGQFDVARNKITIRTHEVSRFALDVSKIGINWNRGVILSIDGNTSEMKKRKTTLVEFRFDPQQGWIVSES